MKKVGIAATLLATVLAAAPAVAEDQGTKDDAVALVKKTVEMLKAQPAADVYKAINAKDAQFAVKDVYVFIHDKKGYVNAHWANAKLVATDVSENTDAKGREYVKERLEAAKTNASFTHTYLWSKTSADGKKTMAEKEGYCEVLKEDIICAGYYK